MTQTTMLDPGRNCWAVAQASRAHVIVDADDYFRIARAAMLRARHQILLVGWDFDARIRFKGEAADDNGPEEVGAFISWLVRRTPGLHVHILRWDTGAIKTLMHGRTLARLARWIWNPQVHLRLDSNHPFGASHHQKVLVIDDDAAFCGGIDMTRGRWDTRDHRDDDPRRVEPDGTPSPPWHDATTLLEGEVAQALGEMCRARWNASGGDIEPPPTGSRHVWPPEVEADFAAVAVGIALTVPDMPDQPSHHEIEALYVDLIATAQRWVYAESQYFASRRVAEAIAARLEEADGPEIVIVHPVTAEGWLEPIAMDSARARLVAALQARDPHRRLRLYHPFTAGGTPIYVHAKVTVVDDRLLRIGSSNFNNRSLRLDTECDVVIDAAAQPDPAQVSRTVAGIRDALLAEHLGTDCATVEATLAETGSLIATIERLRGPGRSLRPYRVEDLDEVSAWLADNKILDPEGPGEMFEGLAGRTPLLHRLRRGRRATLPAGIGAAVIVGGAAALLAWRGRRR